MHLKTIALMVLVISGGIGVAISGRIGLAVSGKTTPEDRSVNGGTGCAACTAVLGLLQQWMQINDELTVQIIDKACELLPTENGVRATCKAAVAILGTQLINIIVKAAPPDAACHALEFCRQDDGLGFCRLFPEKLDRLREKLLIEEYRRIFRKIANQHGVANVPSFCELPELKPTCDWLENIFENHVPGFDEDGDRFSTFPTLRGYNWRGRDCNDSSNSIYPGRRPLNGDREADSNCNGIFGYNPDTGNSFEEEFCGSTGPQGVAVLGDSASAHFSIPKQWITAADWSAEVFKSLPYVLSNEFDWPSGSAVTGYENITLDIHPGNTRSIYQFMSERNKCNHRDYQNLGVNGARSSNMLRFQKALTRDQSHDQPLLVFYSLIGNDVCNGRNDTLSGMTTPEEMKANAKETLQFLAAVLPTGSHVLMTGLADGRILYEALEERIHPIGEFDQDVTYPQLFEYLTCLQISPCNGWLTRNATLRDLTFQRRTELNVALEETATEAEFANFDVAYMDDPLPEIVADWEARHGADSAWQLIEPADGFHPSQVAMAEVAEVTWAWLLERRPGFVGSVNPRNGEISQVFGDQGAH